MDWRNMAKENEGFHSVETFSKKAGLGRQTAINYLHALKKSGFAESARGRSNKRLYRISPLRLREVGYPGLIETINLYSSIKLASKTAERVDHELKPEEAIPRAIETGNFRIILASLELFRHVGDWWELYRHSKTRHVERAVGALYILSRRLFRVRSIDRRVLSLLRKAKTSGYIIPPIKSRDFKGIQKEWGISIPFNKSDLAGFAVAR